MVRTIVFLWMFVWITGASAFSDTPGIREAIYRLQSAVERGDVDRIDLFCVPPDVSFRARLDAEMLRTQFYYRITVGKPRVAHFMKRIWPDLIASTERKGKDVDLRWALVFYDEKGHIINDLYLAGSRGDGQIGELPVTFTKGFEHWVESQFTGVLRYR